MLLLGEDTPTSSYIWRPCPECHEATKHHLLKFGFLLLVRFNLGFTTEGRLDTVLILPSSWGSQRAVLTSHQAVFWRRCQGTKKNNLPRQLGAINKFSGAIAGEKEDFYKGSLACTIFYFVLILLYFIFACIFLSKIQKISFLYSCFYLLAFSLARMGTPENTKLCDFTSTKNNDLSALLLRHLLLRHIFMRSNLLC
jgi:hypothetical protein